MCLHKFSRFTRSRYFKDCLGCFVKSSQRCFSFIGLLFKLHDVNSLLSLGRFWLLIFLLLLKKKKLKERKKLYVPRVEDRNSNMKMLMISGVNDLIEKSMNILEPALADSDGNKREDGMIFRYLLLCLHFKLVFVP